MPSPSGPPTVPGTPPALPDPAGLPPALRRMEAQFGFQRRSWFAERLAWLVMLGVVLGGLMGAFGGAGWLAEAEASTPDGALRIRYASIQRLTAPTVLRVEAAPNRPDGRLDLSFGPELLAHWRVTGLVPPPLESRGEAGHLVLTYQVSGAGAAPALLLQAEPERPGLARVSIGRGGDPPLTLRILVWP
jgi:hypothetical protein